MKYTEEYLEESIGGLLASPFILGTIPLKVLKDVAGRVAKRPFDMILNVGDAKIRSNLRRSGSSFAGGGVNSKLRAIQSTIGADPLAGSFTQSLETARRDIARAGRGIVN